MRESARPDIVGVEILFSVFRAFADRFRNLPRLTESYPNLAFLISHDQESAKAETTPTFDHLGATIDENNLLKHVGRSPSTVTPYRWLRFWNKFRCF